VRAARDFLREHPEERERYLPAVGDTHQRQIAL